MKIVAAPGTQVAAGDTIVIVEAMKQESPITSDVAGVVRSVEVGVGDVLGESQVIATVEEK